MGIEYAFGVAAILLVTYVSFLFLFKVKEVTVDLSMYENGVYFVKCTNQKDVKTIAIIKQ